MDRFVIREPRIGADFPQGNQMIGFGSNLTRSSNMIPENMYLGGYGGEFPMPQHVTSPGYFGVPQQMGSTNYSPQPMNVQLHLGQSQMSGIDPRYLAAYSDGNAQYIATGQNIHNERARVPMNFGSDYENRNFTAPDRNKPKTLLPQVSMGVPETKKPEIKLKNIYNTSTASNTPRKDVSVFGFPDQQAISNVSNKNSNENLKDEPTNKIVSRSDKLKALYKTGPRVFSGPIEKILKWHKALQEIGVTVIYEIVAKCVSVRPGESCAKNLVVRDEGGPAMQVVYYEIDFLLPEIKPPCTVRVVGRMMAGTCRLHAFSVRAATGDDVAMLPRRAAVAAHHVGKLCNEYGVHL